MLGGPHLDGQNHLIGTPHGLDAIGGVTPSKPQIALEILPRGSGPICGYVVLEYITEECHCNSKVLGQDSVLRVGHINRVGHVGKFLGAPPRSGVSPRIAHLNRSCSTRAMA